MNYKTIIDLIKENTRAIAINGVPQVKIISYFFSDFIKSQNNTVISIKATDIENPDLIKKHILDILKDDYPLNFKKINNMKHILNRLDTTIDDKIYFVVEMPRMYSYQDDLIIEENKLFEQEAHNEQHKKRLFYDRKKEKLDQINYIALSWIRDEYKNIKFIYVGNWNRKLIEKMFEKAGTSYPTQDCEWYLSQWKINKYYDIKNVKGDRYLTDINEVFETIIDYTKGEICSTLFLCKKINNISNIHERIKNLRHDMCNDWKKEFTIEEIQKIKEIFQNGSLLRAKKDDNKINLLRSTNLLKVTTKSSTEMFRPINYFSQQIIYNLTIGKSNLPNSGLPVFDKNIELLKKTLIIEKRLKSFIGDQFEFCKNINIKQLPFSISFKPKSVDHIVEDNYFVEEENLEDKLSAVQGKYNSSFEDINWDSLEIVDALTFGELIHLFDIIYSKIIFILEDKEIENGKSINNKKIFISAGKTFIYQINDDKTIVLKNIDRKQQSNDQKIQSQKEIYLIDQSDFNKLKYKITPLFNFNKKHFNRCKEKLEKIRDLRNAAAHTIKISDEYHNRFNHWKNDLLFSLSHNCDN